MSNKSAKRSVKKSMKKSVKKLASGMGYCVKCKAHSKMIGVTESKTKNGQPMLRGRCERCNTKMCKFVKKN